MPDLFLLQIFIRCSNLEEINQELVQTIQQIGGAKFEFGTATTTGATRTIALQGTYTELLYFDLIYTSGLSTFKLRDISFSAPDTITFKIPTTSEVIAGAITVPYIFIGK